jgi:hypothetical protein
MEFIICSRIFDDYDEDNSMLYVCSRPVWRGILTSRENPGLLLARSILLQAPKWMTQTANGKPLGEYQSKSFVLLPISNID